MNYLKVYTDIIENRLKFPLSDIYIEKHHIIPKSLGGSDDKSNLVGLTAREHFICHLLLTKIYTKKNENAKMIRAFMMMSCKSTNQERYTSSRSYEKLKVEHSKVQSELQKGSNNSQFGTHYITNGEEFKKVDKNLVIPDGWVKGKKLNLCLDCKTPILDKKHASYCKMCRKAHYANNGKMNSNFFLNCGSKSYEGRHFITNGEKDKLISVNLSIPEGWYKGRSQNKHKNNGEVA